MMRKSDAAAIGAGHSFIVFLVGVSNKLFALLSSVELVDPKPWGRKGVKEEKVSRKGVRYEWHQDIH